MAQDLITVSSDVLPSDIHVVTVKGKEGISEPYRFEIAFQTEDESFDVDAAVRARATLTFDLGLAGPYQFHGIFAAVEHLHSWAGKTLLRGLLVPQLWQSQLTLHSRVFIDDTVPQFIEKVLLSSGLTADDFQFKLQGNYAPLEFVAQYKESNYHFISRWLEREGMYFFFEQGEHREKLIITDAKAFHDPQPGGNVRYVPLSGQDAMALEALTSFRKKSSALPAKIELLDYDYINPSLDVVGNADVASGMVGEISSFGDNFLTQNEGNRLAQIRAQEYLARQKVFHGSGRQFQLRPGYTFTLDEHPRDAFNVEYLTTSIEHRANQSATEALLRDILEVDFDDEYACTVRAIPATVQYRSPDRFAWPRIDGYEGAVVCGPADSQYAQIDEHGRYKVRIKFDEADLEDGSASTWVRMQQPHGGTNEGFHFPLRKGTEVLLFFQGGDPDRPVIAGVVPNAHTPSPVINNNYTTNIIQTGGMNLILMEDNAGQQYIYQYCPTQNTYLHLGFELNEWNIELNTEGHAHFHIGGDQVIDIDVTLTENVQNDVTFNYNQNFNLNVISDWTIEISGLKFEHVCLSVELNYDSDYALTILGVSIIDITGTWDVHVGGDVTMNFDSNMELNVGPHQEVHVHGTRKDTVDGKVTLEYGELETNVKADHKWNILGHKVEFKAANDTTITVGLTNEVFIGFKNSLALASVNETFIGFKDELKLAGESSIFIGSKEDMVLAVRRELSLALDFKAAFGAKLELDAVVDLGQKASEVKQTGPAVHTSVIIIMM